MNVYDFDDTIYYGDSTINFYKFCLKKNPLLIRVVPKFLVRFVKYKFKKCDKTYMKEAFYEFLRYVDDPEKEIKLFWEQNMSRIKPFYLNQKREDDLIISASPTFSLKIPAQKLGFELIASEIDIKTGKALGKNVSGEEKARLFRQHGGEMEKFYSDSYNDEPLSRLAKEAYMVKGDKITPWKHKDVKEK